MSVITTRPMGRGKTPKPHRGNKDQKNTNRIGETNSADRTKRPIRRRDKGSPSRNHKPIETGKPSSSHSSTKTFPIFVAIATPSTETIETENETKQRPHIHQETEGEIGVNVMRCINEKQGNEKATIDNKHQGEKQRSKTRQVTKPGDDRKQKLSSKQMDRNVKLKGGKKTKAKELKNERDKKAEAQFGKKSMWGEKRSHECVC